MKISGFTFVRNATKFYYPVKASILSILPIVDEFVVALGKGDPDDRTLEEIEKIGDARIRIIQTEWDLSAYPRGTEYAHQTDIAKEACTGDWLFYIQSDEVIHEKYLPAIEAKCASLFHDEEVEGLLFHYRHFWGDYQHYLVSHAWYPEEIRIIRNRPDIHSWRDAQSFRVIPEFTGDYFQHKDTRRLKVARVEAWVNHYGWVRPPAYMQSKRREFSIAKRGVEATDKMMSADGPVFDYGDLSKLKIFRDSHPAVMKEWVDRFDWSDQLYPNRPAIMQHKHNNLKYRVLTYIEHRLLGGRRLGGFKNYKLIR